MASMMHMEGLKRLLTSGTGGYTIKVVPVMTNTTVDTEKDVNNVDAFTTEDFCDSATFAWTFNGSGHKTITVTPTRDDAGDEVEQIVSASTTWAALANGTRQIQGVLVYLNGSSDFTTAYPVGYYEFSGTINPGGADLTLNWNAEGLFKISVP